VEDIGEELMNPNLFNDLSPAQDTRPDTKTKVVALITTLEVL
jgi:hypothetical protein